MCVYFLPRIESKIEDYEYQSKSGKLQLSKNGPQINSNTFKFKFSRKFYFLLK